MEAVCGWGFCSLPFSHNMAIATSRERNTTKTMKNEDKKHARSQDIPSGRSSNPLSAMVADVVGIEITGKEHRDLNET